MEYDTISSVGKIVERMLNLYHIVTTNVPGAVLYGIEGKGARAECLSQDRWAVEALAALCQKEALDPIHLRDVAEDWFS